MTRYWPEGAACPIASGAAILRGLHGAGAPMAYWKCPACSSVWIVVPSGRDAAWHCTCPKSVGVLPEVAP